MRWRPRTDLGVGAVLEQQQNVHAPEERGAALERVLAAYRERANVVPLPKRERETG